MSEEKRTITLTEDELGALQSLGCNGDEMFWRDRLASSLLICDTGVVFLPKRFIPVVDDAYTQSYPEARNHPAIGRLLPGYSIFWHITQWLLGRLESTKGERDG